jgi:hypothetical protein
MGWHEGGEEGSSIYKIKGVICSGTLTFGLFSNVASDRRTSTD